MVKVARALCLLAAGAATLLGTAACGGKASLAHGRELFQNGTGGGQACSFCHTLRAALAAGPFGPNLDRDAQRRRAVLGLDEGQLRRLYRDRIHDATCLDRNDPSRCMPPDLVTGGDAADVAAFIARCADAAGVDGCMPPKPADALAAKGQVLFGAHYCQGCHSTNGNVVVAPTVKGLAGSNVALTNGQTVVADDRYLLRSILTPDAQIVRGYKPGYMASLVKPGSISPAQARALVAYIKTLK